MHRLHRLAARAPLRIHQSTLVELVFVQHLWTSPSAPQQVQALTGAAAAAPPPPPPPPLPAAAVVSVAAIPPPTPAAVEAPAAGLGMQARSCSCSRQPSGRRAAKPSQQLCHPSLNIPQLRWAIPVSQQLSPALEPRAVACLSTAAGATAAAAAAAADSSPAVGGLPPLQPGLYVVATPIGNLEDITYRAVRVLKSVSAILCEDTRHTRKLLSHFGVTTPTVSLHEHNEKLKTQRVLDRLQAGEPLALVSDAGVPAISDPGAVLVAAAAAAGHRVIPIPGACAAVAALCASGLPTQGFQFVGFLPDKRAARKAAIARVAPVPVTLVLYVPPHDLLHVLGDLVEGLGPGRSACVARELTKLHETFHRGTLQECLDNFSPGGAWQHQVKGEIVLLVEGATAVQSDLQLATLLDAGPAPPGSPGTGMETLLGATGPAPASSPAAFRQQLTDAARMHLLAGASVADVTARLMSATGLKRNKVYSLVLQVRQKLVAEGQLSSA